MRTLRATMRLALGCAGMLLTSGFAGAQGTSVVLIVSQPAEGVAKEKFVDLAPHLQPALIESGKYTPIVYRSSDSAIQNAIKAGQLSASEVMGPISHETAHKIVKALNAGAVLYVSANLNKDGVGMSALLEMLTGQNSWSQVYQDSVTAAKDSGKRLGLLESIHSHVDRIMQRMTGANLPATPTVSQPRTDPQQILADVQKAQAAAGKTASGSDKPASDANKTGPTSGGSQNPAAMVVPPRQKKDNLSTYEILIDRARRNGDVASLIVALRKAINERPRDVRLRRDLASAYRDRGMNDLAKEEAERAATLAPEDGAVHRLIADVLRDSGDIAGAMKEYQEAVRRAPNDPASHLALGDALMADGKDDEALKELQAAAQLDAKSPVPQLRIARLDIRRGSYADAVGALTAAKGLAANSDTASFLADCGAILTVVESTLADTLPRLLQVRTAFNNGTKTREESFKEVTALRKKADDVATFLDAMPDVGLTKPQALYGQAASLAVQAADKLMEHLETQSTGAAEESNLLRIEANKQMGEASKRLKALLDTRSNR